MAALMEFEKDKDTYQRGLDGGGREGTPCKVWGNKAAVRSLRVRKARGTRGYTGNILHFLPAAADVWEREKEREEKRKTSTHYTFLRCVNLTYHSPVTSALGLFTAGMVMNGRGRDGR